MNRMKIQKGDQVKIRIIAGKFGGRNIKTPDGTVTHPMSERVRGALFNIMNSKLDDADVLDVFSGSGSLGLEALSRGARTVTFIDRDKNAYDAILENIKLLDVENSTTLFKVDLNTWINKNSDACYDVIFADPPYDRLQLSTVEKVSRLLKPKGLMVLSYPGKGEVPLINEFVVVDNRSYGNAALAFYQRK